MPVFHLIFAQSSGFVFAAQSSCADDSLIAADWCLGAGNELIIQRWFCYNNPSLQVLCCLCQRSQGGPTWAYLALNDLISACGSHFAEYSPDLDQHDIALNEINIFDQWNIFASLNLTQSLWSVTVVEIVQVKWSILIEFTFSTASVSNIRREIIRIWQHASCSPQQCSKSYVTLNLLSEVLQDFMPNYTRS